MPNKPIESKKLAEAFAVAQMDLVIAQHINNQLSTIDAICKLSNIKESIEIDDENEYSADTIAGFNKAIDDLWDILGQLSTRNR
jgi:hypothetical protein